MRRPAVLARAQHERKRRERATDNDRRHAAADRLIERTRGRGRPDPVNECNHGAGGDEGIQEPQPRGTHGRDQHQRLDGAPGEAGPRRDDRGDPGADHEGPADAEALLDAGRVQALGDGEPLGGERGDESRDEQGGLVAEAENPEDQRGRDESQQEERDARERAGAAPAAGTPGYDGARNRSAQLGRPPPASVPRRAMDANGSSWAGFRGAGAAAIAWPPRRTRRSARNRTTRSCHAAAVRPRHRCRSPHSTMPYTRNASRPVSSPRRTDA